MICEKNEDIHVTNEEFLQMYPIESAFPKNKDLYFQTQLFKICSASSFADSTTPSKKTSKKTQSTLQNQNELSAFIISCINSAFNPISHTLWSMVSLTKKYSDFKNMSDYDRLQHVEGFAIRPNSRLADNVEFDMIVYQKLVLRNKYSGIENSYLLTYSSDVGFKHDQERFATLPNIPNSEMTTIDGKTFEGRFQIIQGNPHAAVKDRNVIPDGTDVSTPTVVNYANKLSSVKLNKIEPTIDESLNLFDDAYNARPNFSGGTKLNKRTRKRMMLLVKSMKTKRKNKLSKRLKKSKRHHRTKHSTKQRKYTRKR